ncbi:MAG TPA: hypothetical protein VGM84_17000 [Steroidobacteraceae bacterium]
MSAYAMPSLLDPEQWRAHSDLLFRKRGNLLDANQAAEEQLKTCLLSAGEIVISDGFVFDNPSLWQLLRQNDGMNAALAKSCVILSTGDADADLAQRFRSWFFRAKGVVSPSVLRGAVVLSDPHRLAAEQQLRELAKPGSHRDTLSFADYGSMMRIDHLQPSEAQLAEFFRRCKFRPKNSDRHTELGQHLRTLVTGLTFLSQGIPTDERERLVRYLTATPETAISRSNLGQEFPKFWAIYERLVNNSRQLTFASHMTDPSTHIALNPAWGRQGKVLDEALVEATKEIHQARSGRQQRWSCGDISIEAIMKIRSERDFPETSHMLSLAEGNLLFSIDHPDKLQAALAYYNETRRRWESLMGSALNKARSKKASSPSTERKVAADLASGLLGLALTAVGTTLTGHVGIEILFRLSQLIGTVATKYQVLGAAETATPLSLASLAVPGRRKAVTQRAASA